MSGVDPLQTYRRAGWVLRAGSILELMRRSPTFGVRRSRSRGSEGVTRTSLIARLTRYLSDIYLRDGLLRAQQLLQCRRFGEQSRQVFAAKLSDLHPGL